jgi:hypothetical protein
LIQKNLPVAFHVLLPDKQNGFSDGNGYSEFKIQGHAFRGLVDKYIPFRVIGYSEMVTSGLNDLDALEAANQIP